MKTQPTWIDQSLFPFESKWFGDNHDAMHYIDEGTGPVVLFVHGCPEWSFGFRDLVKELRSTCRCVVVDHLGFGLSAKPRDADYSIAAHSARLTKFIGHLDLRNITLVANDFGGGIGLGYAVNHPNNINALVLFNTWCWSLKDDPQFSTAGKVMKTALMKFLYLRFNFSVNVVMPRSFGNKKKLTREVHDHYRKVLPDAASRTAVYAIARELADASDWWEAQWKKFGVLAGKPVRIFWGMKDTFVPARFLSKWREAFPGADVVEVPDAGHFVQEERPDVMATGIRSLLTTQAHAS